MTDLPQLVARDWITVTGRGRAAVMNAEQLPPGLLTASELLNQCVVIDGHVYLVTGVETCRVNHHVRCTAPFALAVGPPLNEPSKPAGE
jgi:hypothetical protein